MAGSYEGCVVVVTGGSTGLGRAIAVGAAREGASAVIVNYASNDAEAEVTAGLIRDEGAEAVLAKGDVGEEATCERIVAAAQPFGRIDALFNNAGLSTVAAYLDLDKLAPDDFMRIYRVNVVGPYFLTRSARPLLEASDRAAVVMTSSIAGVTGGGSSIAYAASKAALNAMTKGLARAVAPKIRVNAICPGFIDTPWFDKLDYEGGRDRLREYVSGRTPLKAASGPEDIAGSALFLGSLAARHVTGETLLADAGMHLTNA